MKQYEEPKAEVIIFDNDVITASGDNQPIGTHSGGSDR